MRDKASTILHVGSCMFAHLRPVVVAVVDAVPLFAFTNGF